MPAPTLSVVSPVYGCSGCLDELVERIQRAFHGTGESVEIVLVDDGSPDDAWARIEALAAMHPAVHGVRLSRNFGQHHAIFAGLDHARADLVVVMDCDLQDQPEEIPRLLAALRAAPGAEIAYAARIQRHDPWSKRILSRMFYAVLGYFTGVGHDHRVANFGVYSRHVVEVLQAMPESERCFPLMVRWTGLAAVTEAVEHAPRTQGRSAYGFRAAARLALNMVLAYSDKPLRLVVKLGMCLALVAAGVVLLSVYLYFSGKTAVAGYTSIIASIWLLGGGITFCVGVVGLYVGQMFKDAKRRPHYVVRALATSRAPGDA